MKKMIFAVLLFSLSLTAEAAGPNLVPNPGLETAGTGGLPQDWFAGAWGANTRSFVYPVPGRNGGNAARVEISAYTSGDAKWYFSDAAVLPNAIYEFSDYYKSDAPSSLVIRYATSGGTFVYADIKTEIPAAANWTRFSDTFVTPENAVSLTIFHLIKGVGYLETDDYSLTKSDSSDPSHFEEGMVSLNFDDGYTSVYGAVNSIINPAGLKSSHFIIVNYSLGSYAGFMTPAQILELQSQGHEIGSQALTHANLTSLAASDALKEITDSRTLLIGIGASPVDYFDYPYGQYNYQLEEMVKQAGYSGTLSSDAGYNLKTTAPYALKRQMIDILTPIEKIKQYIDTAISEKVWLILSFHRIETDYTADIYNNLPETLQQTVDYLKTKNAKVVTVAEGINAATAPAPTPPTPTPAPTPTPTPAPISGNGPVSLGNYTGTAISAPSIPPQETATIISAVINPPAVPPILGSIAMAANVPPTVAPENIAEEKGGEEIALESGTPENALQMLAEPELYSPPIPPQSQPEEMSLAAAVLTFGTGNYLLTVIFMIIIFSAVYVAYYIFKKT